MIATMIMTLLLIGVMGNLMFYGFSYYNTSTKRNAITANDRLGIEAKTLLVQNIYQMNGRAGYYAPLGDLSDNGWTTLPSFFGSKRYNNSGIPFLYCPFSSTDSGVTSTKTVMPNETSYSVRTESNPSRSGYPYVVESSYQNNSLIAAIISPIGRDNTPPNCYDIEYSNGSYSVPNGQVWAINELDVLSGGGLTTNNAYNNTTQNIYVTSEATTSDVANGGTEDDSESSVSYSSQSLVTNIERFKNSDIEEMRLYLGSGEYVIQDDDLFVDNEEFFNSTDRKLVLFGSSSERPAIRSESGNELEFYMPYVQLEINNVDFDTFLNMKGNTFIGEDSSIGRIGGTDGNVKIKDFSFTDVDDRNINIEDSRLIGYGDIDFNNTMAYTENSDVKFIDSDLTFNIASISGGENVISLTRNSRANFTDGAITVTNSGTANTFLFNSRSTVNLSNSISTLNGNYAGGILNTGMLQIDGSTINLDGNMTYGIYSFRNGLNKINGSDIFNTAVSTDAPTYGFFDVGSTLSVSGSSSTFSSTIDCFEGDIFDTSSAVSSAPTTANYRNNNNAATWVCN